LADIASTERIDPGPLAAVAVTLCGVCAFLELYCTQPLLPLLAHIFHASKTAVGLTVSAATLSVALAGPFVGRVTERLPRKKVIVWSVTGIALPTLLTATAPTLGWMIFWRFLQGLFIPSIIAVVVTYIGEEWPPERMLMIMSFYVSGTVLGGFIGRVSSGLIADWINWQASFLFIGVLALISAGMVALWMPPGNRRAVSAQKTTVKIPLIEFFRRPRLVATFAVGFSVLFSLVGVFSWITFHLAAPPFSLSTAALSSLFFVYLVGLVVTPMAGMVISKVGMRVGVCGAILCSMIGVLLTLAPSIWAVVAGLAMVSSGVFIAQTASQSHLRVAAPPGGRVTAAGLYITSYYVGGTMAGVLPGAFWALGKWPACAAFIVSMQACALLIAARGWRGSELGS
jgi:predicted MFS family arabinose efflux permease